MYKWQAVGDNLDYNNSKHKWYSDKYTDFDHDTMSNQYWWDKPIHAELRQYFSSTPFVLVEPRIFAVWCVYRWRRLVGFVRAAAIRHDDEIWQARIGTKISNNFWMQRMYMRLKMTHPQFWFLHLLNMRNIKVKYKSNNSLNISRSPQHSLWPWFSATIFQPHSNMTRE